MKLSFITACITFLHLAGICCSHPLEQRIVEILEPEDKVIILEISQINGGPSNRKPRQDDGGVDAGDAAEGLESTAQIGTNVIKVVTSALTGNVNGIFDGSFNLFGTGDTRNQVEGFFQSLVGGLVNSIVGPTTANPNKGAASSGTSGSSGSSGTGSASGSSGSSGDSSKAAATVEATTVKAPAAQYVILLNQNGGQIKGATIISPQSQIAAVATSKPAAATVRATTKKSDEDDDEEENEESSGRRNRID